MRMLLSVRFPHDEFNEAIRNGTAQEKIEAILGELKPEAVYFTEQSGQRGAILVVNVDDPSMIPALAEPWFLSFKADVEFRIAMTPDDLRRANLEKTCRKWAQ